MPPDRYRLDCRGLIVTAAPARPRVMGILNVTPDSFSDGGRFLEVDSALHRTEAMIEEGATFIDVGGESSRPQGRAYGEGAAAVDEAEEARRVVPVVEAIRRKFSDVVISVDTYKPAVGRAVLDVGAHVLNDITGLRFGDGLAREAAAAGAPLILMHSRGRPGELPHESSTDTDIVAEVKRSLKTSIRAAREAGVEQLVIDPGFGFGKTSRQNLTLLARCDEFVDLGFPVLIGVSRKATIGRTLGGDGREVPIAERLFGTLGATAVTVMRGASIVRTHDVRATVEMLHVMTETLAAGETTSTETSRP